MVCKAGLSFEECEMIMIRNAVLQIEERVNMNKMITDEQKKITAIIEQYLRDKQHICYGSTAVNALLPKRAQFYNTAKEMPDYDFYSMNPIEDAKEVADIFFKEGFTDIMAKAGMYYGTFRVYVNGICVADITMMPKELFLAIQKEQIVIDGICYAPPDMLRQSMYLELSRPYTTDSLWEIIYPRLLLLNEYYPIDKYVCKNISPSNPHHRPLYNLVKNTLIDLDVVFMGGYADMLYIHYMDKQNDRFVNALPDFDIISETPEKTCEHLKKVLIKNGYNVEVIHHDKLGELVGQHYQVIVDNETVAIIYEPVACHSYNTIRINKKDVHIATIDTLLSYYLIFMYINRPYYDRQKIMCMANLLIEIQKEYRLSNRGLLKRFSIICYGRQKTQESIQNDKSELHYQMRNKKGTREYDMLFLKYIPGYIEVNTRMKPPKSMTSTKNKSTNKSKEKSSKKSKKAKKHKY